MIVAALALLGSLVSAPQDSFAGWMDRAEAAKRKGDMANMEIAIARAHQYGPGDEYSWRSLSWAQMRQGKWREALDNAWQNVRRNGQTSWSLVQLYEAAIEAGDVTLARQALDQELRLPQAARNTDLTSARNQLRSLTAPTLYDLRWTIDPKTYRLQKGELVINIPYRKHLWQTAEVWIEGAKASRIESIDGKDVMFIQPGPKPTMTLRARVRHTPVVRGGSIIDQTRMPLAPADFKSFLGPFRNRIDYNPADPVLGPATRNLGIGNAAQRTQNILDWLRANVKYEHGFPDDLASILKTGKGVCHHQSNLMVAMCRSLGVPALVAHGVSLNPGDGEIRNVEASHGWVEVYLNGVGWTGVEPLDPGSLRKFRSGYLIVDASGRHPRDDHFQMRTPDGRIIEGIQGLKVNGTGRLAP